MTLYYIYINYYKFKRCSSSYVLASDHYRCGYLSVRARRLRPNKSGYCFTISKSVKK
nr:MAG TPA: hypothetical protein [Caudoviricetes sp.]